MRLTTTVGASLNLDPKNLDPTRCTDLANKCVCFDTLTIPRGSRGTVVVGVVHAWVGQKRLNCNVLKT